VFIAVFIDIIIEILVLFKFLTEFLKFSVQMKQSSVVCFFTLFLIHALTVCSTETTIDDKLIQQILDDPQLSALLDDPEKLMDMLQEKLRNPSKSGSDCLVAIKQRHSIIKSKESLAAGAVFLSSLNVDSVQSCVDACCLNSSCNTAIMQQKVY